MPVMKPLSLSFEFFPPKTIEGADNLQLAATQLAEYDPNFFSVTFGAGGSTREGTFETINILKTQFNIEAIPHLAAIGCSRTEIVNILTQYKESGIKQVVALRGDLPSGMGQAGEFKYASELITLIREVSGSHFNIIVAAYPEIHPQAKSAQDDVLNLKRKYEAGANCAITQYFFNPDAYFYYLDECARYHINLPIIPGIMPITQYAKLARFSDMCGAEIPRWIRHRLESYGDDADSIKEFGLEVVYKLCERLLHGGAPGLHFYTLNKAEASIKLVEMFKTVPIRNKLQKVVSIT